MIVVINMTINFIIPLGKPTHFLVRDKISACGIYAEYGTTEKSKVDCLNCLKTFRPKKHRCKKIRAGKYEYRGWIISKFGYHSPDKKICWEGYNPKSGHADFLGFSKREIKALIDEDLG